MKPLLALAPGCTVVLAGCRIGVGPRGRTVRSADRETIEAYPGS